jgi:hypothetical protein
MKRNIVFIAVIAVMLFTLAAMAATPVVKVRVVNVSVLGEDAVTSTEGLVKTATMSLAENPKVFPPIETMVFTVGKNGVKYLPDVTVPAGALTLSGSIDKKEMLDFISIPYSDMAGKFDGAVVSRDGKVTYVDAEIVIDYLNRTITTPKSFTVKDGDVLLLFVKNSDPNPMGEDKKDKEETGRNKPSTNDNRTGGKGGFH